MKFYGIRLDTSKLIIDLRMKFVHTLENQFEKSNLG